MIKTLRKRHLQTWRLLAVLLPLGIISAYLVVPNPAVNQLLQPASVAALPVVLKSVKKDAYVINLRSNSNRTQFQLEWQNKIASVLPSSLIYKVSKPQNELIGRIDNRGIFRFALPSDSSVTLKDFQIIIHDIIHNQTTDTIKILP
ncbi:MAG: hypothetical protein ABJB11_07255 [Ferruginibacter sp.]